MLCINGNRLKATTATNIHVKNAKRAVYYIEKGATETVFFLNLFFAFCFTIFIKSLSIFNSCVRTCIKHII